MKPMRALRAIPSLILVIGLLAACIPLASTPTAVALRDTPAPATATPLPPTATLSVPTPQPSPTSPPPTPTPLRPAARTVSPNGTPGSPSHTPAATSPTLALQKVLFYLVALEDNGKSGTKIGCDDSLVPVLVSVAATDDPLSTALAVLLSIKEPYYGHSGLYNALHQSDLTLESVSVEGGKAVVHLIGTLILGGVCDNPRVEAQIEETALKYPGVSEVSVYVNGQPLEELLSLKD